MNHNQAHAGRPAPGRRRLILVIDDREEVRLAVEAMLAVRGYDVILGTDGIELMPLARAHHPDLILLDIAMPVMDGFSALEQVRDIPEIARIPVIVITARDSAGDLSRATGLGVFEVVPKPFSVNHLVGTIERALGSAGSAKNV